MNYYLPLLFLLLVLILLITLLPKKQPRGAPRWKRCKRRTLNDTFRRVFGKNDFERTDGKDYDIWIPCFTRSNLMSLEFQSLPNAEKKAAFMVHGQEALSRKDQVWKWLERKYGNNAKKIMPQTFLLKDKNDVIKFLNNTSPSKKYILKKNIQRQRGLKIVNSNKAVREINNNHSKYTIIQEFKENPFLLNGRKVNLRIYMAILCKNQTMDSYAHKKGFVYYTAKKYKQGSSNHSRQITSGFLPRSIYAKNPLTLEEFATEIGKQGKNYDELYEKILELLRKTVKATTPAMCTSDGPKIKSSMQLFGVDIFLDSDLTPYIMEINKSPSLDSKDSRDGNLKQEVVQDLVCLAGLGQSCNENNFVKLIK